MREEWHLPRRDVEAHHDFRICSSGARKVRPKEWLARAMTVMWGIYWVGVANGNHGKPLDPSVVCEGLIAKCY